MEIPKSIEKLTRHLWAKIGLKISTFIPPDQIKATLLFNKTLEFRGDWK